MLFSKTGARLTYKHFILQCFFIFMGINFSKSSFSHIMLIEAKGGDSLTSKKEYSNPLHKAIYIYGILNMLTIPVLLAIYIMATESHLSLGLALIFSVLSIGMVYIATLCVIKFVNKVNTHFNNNFGKRNVEFIYTELQNYQNVYSEYRRKLESKMSRVQHLKDHLLQIENEKKTLQGEYEKRKKESFDKAQRLTNMKGHFREIGNALPLKIWKCDAEGHIIFGNDLFYQNVPKDELHTISDYLMLNDSQFSLLRKRDFGEIIFKFKNGELLSGRTTRIFDEGVLKGILFISASNTYEKEMMHQYLKKNRELYIMHEIGRIVSGKNSIESMLHHALRKLSFLENLQFATVRLANDQEELALIASNGTESTYQLESVLKPSKSHMYYAYKRNAVLVVNKKEDMIYDDEFVKQVLEKGYKIAFIPLANYKKCYGVLTVVTTYPFASDNLMLLEGISINLTIAIEKILLYDQLKSSYFKTVEAFVTATEFKSEKYSGHSRRVAETCKAIAEKMYLLDNEVDEIYIAGLLHDVGKLAFSDSVFDEEEEVDNVSHGKTGRKMVQDVGLTSDILDGIEHHALHFDLSNGDDLCLTEQPFYAQIIRIANDLDYFVHSKGNKYKPIDFIEYAKLYSGHYYSPQLIRILESIFLDSSHHAHDIYS